MTDTHLSTDELVIIESYFHQNTPVSKISKQVGRARQTVHNVVTFLRAGHTALNYYRQYKQNKNAVAGNGPNYRSTSVPTLKKR